MSQAISGPNARATIRLKAQAVIRPMSAAKLPLVETQICWKSLPCRAIPSTARLAPHGTILIPPLPAHSKKTKDSTQPTSCKTPLYNTILTQLSPARNKKMHEIT